MDFLVLHPSKVHNEDALAQAAVTKYRRRCDLNNKHLGVPTMAQWVKDPLSLQVPSPTQYIGLRIQHCCSHGVGHSWAQI